LLSAFMLNQFAVQRHQQFVEPREERVAGLGVRALAVEGRAAASEPATVGAALARGGATVLFRHVPPARKSAHLADSATAGCDAAAKRWSGLVLLVLRPGPAIGHSTPTERAGPAHHSESASNPAAPAGAVGVAGCRLRGGRIRRGRCRNHAEKCQGTTQRDHAAQHKASTLSQKRRTSNKRPFVPRTSRRRRAGIQRFSTVA
jgi:hypothetical protein